MSKEGTWIRGVTLAISVAIAKSFPIVSSPAIFSSSPSEGPSVRAYSSV
jgi:hypothetical protein